MITLTKEQAEQIETLLNELYSANDNYLYQFMPLSPAPSGGTRLQEKLDEISTAISWLSE
jgi:hypothetical protein